MTRRRPGLNILANAAALVATSALVLAFNAAYFRLAGQEAYGLIGLQAMITTFAVCLDFGMSRTLIREVARAPEAARSALKTLQWPCWVVAVVLAAAMVAGAGWIAGDWLKLSSLPQAEAGRALAAMGVGIALQQPRTLYLAVLSGLQRQALGSALTVLFAVVRGLAGVAALVLSPGDLVGFFMAQIAASAFETGVSAVTALLALRPYPAGKARLGLIAETWRFALGDGVSMLLGTFISVGDRLVLSKLLPLDLFGAYSLAALFVTMLMRVPSPFTQACLPHFSALLARGEGLGLSAQYHRVAQLVSALLVPAAVTTAAFAAPIALLLTGSADSARLVAPVLTLLALAAACNALCHVPHTLQLAAGKSHLSLWANIAMGGLFFPAVLVLTPLYGILVPAASWLAVNLIVLPVFAAATHRWALPGEFPKWLGGAVLRPFAAAAVLAGLGVLLAPALTSWPAAVAWLGASFVAQFAAVVAVSPALRGAVLSRRFAFRG